jgi:hypothetical protein
MIIGTRVLYPEEINTWNAEILQISLYKGMKGNLEMMKNCADRCREAGIHYVIHPVGYPLLRHDTFPALKEMAEHSDLALILHDEKGPDARRLCNENEQAFRSVLEKLRSITNISFENATDTRDVVWFWEHYAESVTLDLGHVESSGINAVDFVRTLNRATIEKIQFVHMHRNNGLHGGITDHWPILPDCREYKALRELLGIKPDVSVLLEINETEQIGESLKYLDMLRSDLKI